MPSKLRSCLQSWLHTFGFLYIKSDMPMLTPDEATVSEFGLRQSPASVSSSARRIPRICYWASVDQPTHPELGLRWPCMDCDCKQLLPTPNLKCFLLIALHLQRNNVPACHLAASQAPVNASSLVSDVGAQSFCLAHRGAAFISQLFEDCQAGARRFSE